jgi:uncharacterized SAM-binding protein YcdF (DUF218 family)
MSIYLTKVLAVFALPLAWALFLGLTALVLVARGRRRPAVSIIAAQFGLLWVCAMPWTAGRLTAWLEAPFPPVALEQTPVSDVAIVLGGAVGAVGDPPVENLSGASDRVLRAARLFRAGKARHVLAVGGNQPWLSRSVPEAEAMRDLLVEWGVPREAVFTEIRSENTRENALFAADIVRAQGWERLLLVTSAAHMGRAAAAFRAVGLDVIPSPTDYGVVAPPPLDLLDFLPDAAAFDGTSAIVRELIGRWYYGWRSWLDQPRA